MFVVAAGDLDVRIYQEPAQLMRQLAAETGEWWEPLPEVNYWQSASIYTYKINGIGEMPNTLGPKPVEVLP